MWNTKRINTKEKKWTESRKWNQTSRTSAAHLNRLKRKSYLGNQHQRTVAGSKFTGLLDEHRKEMETVYICPNNAKNSGKPPGVKNTITINSGYGGCSGKRKRMRTGRLGSKLVISRKMDAHTLRQHTLYDNFIFFFLKERCWRWSTPARKISYF